MIRLVAHLFLILTGVAVAQIWRPDPVTAQTSLLEVEKANVKLMQVNDDGGVVALGTRDQGVIPASGPGARLMWYPRKAAFRAGNIFGAEWDDANIGQSSVAMGINTTASSDGSTAIGTGTRASGEASMAMGHGTTASGHQSTAMGENTKATGPVSTSMGLGTTASGLISTAMGVLTTASGQHSTAMGELTAASGRTSTAMGFQTTASGEASTAMGSETKAIGSRSTAMGFKTTATDALTTVMGSNAGTFGGAGSFVYGDASTSAAVVSGAPNEFLVRAAGGFRFRTSPTLNTGCDLPPGSGTFACTSSRLAKEGFEDVDGEQILGNLAAMRIQRWRYIGTKATHVGPVAEDFHAAFGLGQGPTTISTVDADGISLLAVQALERRTAELREENAELRRRLEALEAERAAERK